MMNWEKCVEEKTIRKIGPDQAAAKINKREIIVKRKVKPRKL